MVNTKNVVVAAKSNLLIIAILVKIRQVVMDFIVYAKNVAMLKRSTNQFVNFEGILY